MAHFGGFQTKQLITILILAVSFSDLAVPGGAKSTGIRRKSTKDEGALMMNLLERYNTIVRPVEKPKDTILVSFGLTLIRIVEVDPVFACLTTNVWQTMEWTDWRLRWDPLEYSNITSLKIPTHRIWFPDVVPYNNGLGSYSPALSTHAVVRSNGTVTHVAPYRMVTSCDINADADEHSCSIHFGSWTYGVSELNLVSRSERGGDLSKYIPHKNWELMGGVPGVRSVKKNSWLPEPYIDITYNLKFKWNSN